MLGHKPFGIGHIVHDTAQRGVLEMGMAIDETRHDRASAEVTHFLLWIVRLHALRAADLHDSSVADEHCAIIDGLACNRDDMFGTE